MTFDKSERDSFRDNMAQENWEGYCGEVTWKVTEQRDGQAFDIHYTGFVTYEGDTMALSPDGVPPHDGEVLVKELFAEGIWGRSHSCCGTYHKVAVKDLDITNLTDPNTLDAELRDKVYEARA